MSLKNEGVRYTWMWEPEPSCTEGEHVWGKEEKVGNCLSQRVCSKCGVIRRIDSSD